MISSNSNWQWYYFKFLFCLNSFNILIHAYSLLLQINMQHNQSNKINKQSKIYYALYYQKRKHRPLTYPYFKHIFNIIWIQSVQHHLNSFNYQFNCHEKKRSDNQSNEVCIIIPSDTIVKKPTMVIEILTTSIASSTVLGLKLHITLAYLAVFGNLYFLHFQDSVSKKTVFSVVFDSYYGLSWILCHNLTAEIENENP